MNTSHVIPVLLALLVAVFFSAYPQLEASGLCDVGGCPEASQSVQSTAVGKNAPATGSVCNCLPTAVLAVVPALPGLAPNRARWRSPGSRGPRDVFIVPEHPPPRPSA